MAGQRPQALAVGGDPLQQPLVELALDPRLVLLGSQDPLLELFELRGYVALGIHQRLLANVIVGHQLLVGLGHLQVVAEYPVETHLERSDAGALALTPLQRQQVPFALAGQRSDAVQLAIHPGADDSALLDGRRWALLQCGLDLGVEIGQRIRGGRPAQQLGRAVGQLCLDPGRRGQGVAQRCRLARPQPAEHGATEQPLGVAHSRQLLAERDLPLGSSQQLGHRLQPALHRLRLAQRHLQPAAQHTATARRDGSIENTEQAPLGNATAGRREDLEVGQGSGVENQPGSLLADREIAHMAQIALLCGARVVEGRGRGAHRRLAVIEPKAAQRGGAQLALEELARLAVVQPPTLVDHGDTHTAALGPVTDHGQLRRRRIDQQQLARIPQAQIIDRLAGVRPAQGKEGARRQIEERGGATIAIPAQRGEKVLLIGCQQLGIADRAGRHHPGHLAAHESLRLAGLLDLVADRHLETGSDGLGKIHFKRVVGHPAHRRFALGTALPGGQGDLEERRRAHRVLEEQLVEIAHAIEQQGVRELRLELQIVAQHRRELRCLGHPRQYSLRLPTTRPAESAV